MVITYYPLYMQQKDILQLTMNFIVQKDTSAIKPQ